MKRYIAGAGAFAIVLSIGVTNAAENTAETAQAIYKRANCVGCHKWHGGGGGGYGGAALSLRKTELDKDQIIETVKCGRPGTGMPFHDQFAYTDKRCYGITRAELGNDVPPEPNAFLNADEIDAVVKYLFAKAIGRGPSTYEDCVEFWGTETRQCEPMKQ